MIPVWILCIGGIGKVVSWTGSYFHDRTSHKLGHPDTRPWIYWVSMMSISLSGVYYMWFNISVAFEPISLIGITVSLLLTFRQWRLSAKTHGYGLINWTDTDDPMVCEYTDCTKWRHCEQKAEHPHGCTQYHY